MNIKDFAGLMSDLANKKAKAHRELTKTVTGDAVHVHNAAAEALEGFAELLIERAGMIEESEKRWRY